MKSLVFIQASILVDVGRLVWVVLFSMPAGVSAGCHDGWYLARSAM